MNKIIFFICCIVYTNCYSQVNTRYIGSDGIPRNYEFLDGNKTPIPIGDPGGIEGSPLFQSKWVYGIIKLQNGSIYSDSALNYSMYDTKLFFKRHGNVYPVTFPVKEFLLKAANDSATEKFYHFEEGFPPIGENDYSTFYEILSDGSSIKLLKTNDKTIRVTYQYSGPVRREYYTEQKYFVFLPDENKMIGLGKRVTLKDLRENLSEYATQIDTYESSNKFKARKEVDLAELFKFLDHAKLQRAL